MAKRAKPAQQPVESTNTDTEPSTTTTSEPGRLALAHFDELYALWPADPRIPSVESRRAWALARNVNPSYVHTWFQRRRPIAKRLKIKIPSETYELPVGNPPDVPIVIKDEPVEVEVPEPVSKQTKKKANVEMVSKKKTKTDAKGTRSSAIVEPEPKTPLKRKRDEPTRDDDPESTQPANKKKKVVPEKTMPTNANDSATNDPKPKRSHKKKIQPDAAPSNQLKETNEEVDVSDTGAGNPALTKNTSKRKRNDNLVPLKQPEENKDVDVDDTAAEAPVSTKNISKRKRNDHSNPTPDDIPAPSMQPKKKAKTTALESPAKQSSGKKRMVRFESSSADMPPSSPTLYASSPPPSDAPTVVDDTLPSSPLSKATNGRAYIQSRGESAAKAKELVADQTQTVGKSKKENRAPLKSALKKTKKSSKHTPEVTAAKAPEEELLLCDHGNRFAPTGFTCVLCVPLGDEDPDATDSDLTEPKEVFDWHFGFSSSPGSLDDYNGVSIDMTPLSAIPFLTSPAAFLAAAKPEPPRAENSGLIVDEDGYIELDGQKFTHDGIAVDEQGATVLEFFPVMPTGVHGWELPLPVGLLMDSEGNWLPEGSDEDAEGEVDEEFEVDVGDSAERKVDVGSDDADCEGDEDSPVDAADWEPPTLWLPSFDFSDD